MGRWGRKGEEPANSKYKAFAKRGGEWEVEGGRGAVDELEKTVKEGRKGGNKARNLRFAI